MERLVVPGRCSGLPVVIEAFFDGEEWQCPACMKRFPGSSDLLVAHVMDKHRYLVKGGNLRREEG